MAKAKHSSPGQNAKDGKVHRVRSRPVTAANLSSLEKARATKAAKRAVAQVSEGSERVPNRQGRLGKPHNKQLSAAGQSTAQSESSSQAVSIDAQPSYASSGGGQPQSSASGRRPAISKSEKHAEVANAAAHPDSAGKTRANDNVHEPAAGLGLQPVLSRYKKSNGRKPTESAQQAASDSSAFQNSLPSWLQDRGANRMGSCVAPSSSEQPRHNPAPVLSASAQSIKTTKGRTAVPQTQQAHTAPDPAQKGPTVVEQEYLQSAQSPEASMRYDCQGLRLLPGDLMLHSECLAAHRAGSNQGNHGSAQPAKYLDGALVVEASTRLDQPYTVGGSCPKGREASDSIASCVPRRPYALSSCAGCGKGSVTANEEAELQESRKTYDEMDVHIRNMLWLRARDVKGRAFASTALAVRDTFVQVCLMGRRTDAEVGLPNMQQSAQACKEYHTMLRQVYGSEKVLSPYVLNIDAIKDYGIEGRAKDLHNFRLLQRRFIVYRPKKAAGRSCATPGDPSHPITQSGQPCAAADQSQAGHAVSDQSAGGQAGGVQNSDAAGGSTSSSVFVDIINSEANSEASAATACSAPSQAADWDETLQDLWQQLQHRTGSLTGKQVQDNSEEATAPSCSLLEGSWQSGHCSTSPLPQRMKVGNAIRNGQQNRAGALQRLYFLDGTFPGALPQGFKSHEDIPGLCCGVDQAVNTMLPEAMQSTRPSNFFKHLCVESTGTASFTMFAPISQATNITPFHQETKKRRSWNCGSGDFIVQPLSTADSVRELERVHAAVMGAHKRHGCLLPLEMYLEEGIPLVCYVRDKPYAEMVELPEQSCHCFLSFSNASAEHPSLKVSCNDWHLDAELSSAYLVEKLVGSLGRAGVEAGSPDDGADTWVATPYAMLQPCTIRGPADPRCTGTWPRPWADEMEGLACSAQELKKQADPENRGCSMEVLLVRSVEKVLDAVNGRIQHTQWNAPLEPKDALKILQDALPVLMDLQQRAVKQSSPKACKSGDGSDAHFSQEYMDVVVGEVQQALAGRNIAAQQADVLLSSSVSARHLSCEAANAAHSSGTSSCGHERHPAHKEKKRTRFGRVQQLQPGEGGVQQGIGHQPSTSQTSTQWSGAAGHQPSAKAGGAHQQQSSDWAAVANLGGSAKAAAAIESRLLPLAQQVWERQQAGQSAASGPPHGTKRLRDSNDEVADDEHAAKRTRTLPHELDSLARTDQVFGIYMHLKHAAGQGAAEQINRHAQNADDKLSEFCSAVEAVTDEELLQLGLPVLRAHWLLAMQQEWQASQLADPYFMQLSKARALRCRLEALHDVGCGRLVEENAKQWGALPMEC